MNVKSLPKNAVYDYTDVCGRKVYHTEKRRYEVTEHKCVGHKSITIRSEKR